MILSSSCIAPFQDPAVLQAMSDQQQQSQIADATTSTPTATPTLPASQPQVTIFTSWYYAALPRGHIVLHPICPFVYW